MGRGSRSRESGVKKEVENFTSGGGGGKSTEPNSDNDGCLFTFRFSLNLPHTDSSDFEIGMPARLNKDHTGLKLELIIGTQIAGAYQGTHEERLQNCINRNYIYEGSLMGIERDDENDIITVELRGKGR